MRFPGHIQKIIEMRDKGLFESDKIQQTATSLIKDWTPEKEDYDQTIMRIEFMGKKNGEDITETHDLMDYFDKKTNISSMARTTGYTCAAVTNEILSGTFSRTGVFSLETFGADHTLTDNILCYLSERNIKFNN